LAASLARRCTVAAKAAAIRSRLQIDGVQSDIGLPVQDRDIGGTQDGWKAQQEAVHV
jgi:hypothetical protein